MSLSNDNYDGDEGEASSDYQNECDDKEELFKKDAKVIRRVNKLTRCGGCTSYVEPLLLLVMFSQFPSMIIQPQYFLMRELENFGNATKINQSVCNASIPSHNVSSTFGDGSDVNNYTLAQSAASYFQLQLTLVHTIPTLVVVMFLGPFSDERGRKWAIIPPVIGMTIATTGLFLNALFGWPLWTILIGHFIFGCSGNWVSILMGCLSYIADVTNEKERHFRIVLTETCMMVPSILSAFGSGFWLEAIGYTWVFLTCALASVLILLYAVFIIPETIVPNPDAKFFSTKPVKAAIKIYTSKDGTNRRWKLNVLLFAFFFCAIPGVGTNISTLFQLNYPLCWGPELIGIQTSIVAAVSILGSAISAKVLGMCLPDIWMAVIGGVMDMAGNIFTFFVKTTAMMLAGTFFVKTTAMMLAANAFELTGILYIPTIRAIMSKLVQQNEVGAVFSGIAFVEILAGLIAHTIFNPIYSVTQEAGHPSMVYLVMAGFHFIGVVLTCIYGILTHKNSRGDDQNQNILT